MQPAKVLPELDLAVLQEKANEFAMKGAIECLKDYYSGYNSPFRKKINEELQKQEISWVIPLPDIMAMINDALVEEMDAIVNNAIAHTYAPMVKQFFTRVDAEIKFSDILKEFIEHVEPEYPGDCEVSVKENMQYGWLNVTIEHEKRTYELTLHEDYDSKNKGIKKYQILGLPHNTFSDSRKDKMIYEMDGGKLEMPMQRDILKDKFLSYIARVIICGSLITMDTSDFDESMFPERCHCD